MGDFFKSLGYATACFGKWHLGHHKETLPISNGFDTYFGIPYSNDMNHPDNKGKPRGGPAGMDPPLGGSRINLNEMEYTFI